jgi:predicted ATPase
VLPRYREGAWLIELQAVRDPEAVPGAVAAVFRLADRTGVSTLEVLIHFLQTKHLLLVLDNCEHLLDPVAGLVEALERSCPEVVVLATSRQGLALEGERVIPVRALSTPDTDADVASVADSDASGCLWTGRAGWILTSRCLTAIQRRWPRCAGAWTACPWPSSWPQPESVP